MKIAVLHHVVEDSDGEVTVDSLRQLGVPEVVAGAVEALTHQEDESRADCLRRVKANPYALAVKLVDNRDNSDEERLALLDRPTADRYRAKCAADRRVLGVQD